MVPQIIEKLKTSCQLALQLDTFHKQKALNLNRLPMCRDLNWLRNVKLLSAVTSKLTCNAGLVLAKWEGKTGLGFRSIELPEPGSTPRP